MVMSISESSEVVSWELGVGGIVGSGDSKLRVELHYNFYRKHKHTDRDTDIDTTQT
jgi:hypothetical protein